MLRPTILHDEHRGLAFLATELAAADGDPAGSLPATVLDRNSGKLFSSSCSTVVADGNDWSFLTNHARALLFIAHDPDARLRDLAAALDVTERTAYGIVADLTEGGLRGEGEGRPPQPVPHPGPPPLRDCHRSGAHHRRGPRPPRRAPRPRVERRGSPATGADRHRARRGVAAARADDVFLYSAALAFYGLISVAPLVVVALWITSLVVGQAQVHHVADELARLAPPALGADRALERVADLGTTLGLAAVVAALWPATAYGSALVRVLDRVAGDRAAAGLRGRGVALLLVCLVPVLVLGSLVASYAGAAALGDTPGGDRGRPGCSPSSPGSRHRGRGRGRLQGLPPDAARLAGDAPGRAGGGRACISVLSAGYVAYLRLGANFEQRYASATISAVVLLGLWLLRRQHRPHRRLPGRPPVPGSQPSTAVGRPPAKATARLGLGLGSSAWPRLGLGGSWARHVEPAVGADVAALARRRA